MRDRVGEPVKLPHDNRIKLAAVRVSDQAIQFWPRVLRPRHSHVNVFARDIPSSTLAIFPQLPSLHVWVLPVACRYSCVDYGSHFRSLLVIKSCFRGLGLWDPLRGGERA